MNYYLLIYPLLSLISFYVLFIYYQFAVFLLFLSPYFLLTYLENPERTGKTDAVCFALYIASAVFEPLRAAYFIPLVLLPMLITFRVRKAPANAAYLAPLAAPIPLFVTLWGLMTFFPSFREAVSADMLEFINVFTAPIADSPQRFDDLGILSVIMADKAKAARYMTDLLPCVSYSAVAVFTYVTDKIKRISSSGAPRDFRLPDGLVWIMIPAGFIVMLNNPAVKTVSVNLLFIFGVLYFLQGTQIAAIIFDRFKIPLFLRAFVYAFLLIEPPVAVVVTLTGLFSIWFRPGIFLRSETTGGENDGRK